MPLRSAALSSKCLTAAARVPTARLRADVIYTYDNIAGLAWVSWIASVARVVCAIRACLTNHLLGTATCPLYAVA